MSTDLIVYAALSAPVVYMENGRGGFIHALTPDQARDLARELMLVADQAEASR